MTRSVCHSIITSKAICHPWNSTRTCYPVEKRRIHTPLSWRSSFDSHPSREKRLTCHSQTGFTRYTFQGVSACSHRNSLDYVTCRKCSLDLLPKFQPLTWWSKSTNYSEGSDPDARIWTNSLFKDGNLTPSVGVQPSKSCPWSSHSSNHIRCIDDSCGFFRKHPFHSSNPMTNTKARAA